MYTPMTPALLKALRASRERTIAELEDEMPEPLEIVEYVPGFVSIHAREWGNATIVGRCVNLTGDGPDLDDQGRPMWSWAVGVGRIGEKVDATGAFATDLRISLNDLRRSPARRRR